MAPLPALRRSGPAAGAAVVFAAICLVGASSNLIRDVPDAMAAPAPARSWPMFGGAPGRNLENLVEKDIASTWTLNKDGTGKNVKWSVQLGSKAYGGLIISGGHIYVGTNNFVPREPEIKGDKGVLMCFNEADGKFLWQSVHDKLATGRVNDWEFEGIASSPCVEGDRLWYVSNRCELICASTEGLAAGNRGVADEKYDSKTDADIIWRLDMMKDLGVFPHNLAVCSPLVVGDTVFVTTGNGVDEGHKNVPAPDAPSFIAVDKNTGAVKWMNNDPGSHILHGQWSSPAYAAPNGKPMVIFAGGDGWIRAFNPPDGALIWKFDGNPKKSVYTLGPEGTRSDFLGTPVIYKNKLYIATGQDPEHGHGVGHLWCIDITKTPKNKDKDLSPVNDNFDPKAPENKDSALVWHYGGNAPEDFERFFYFGRSMSTCCVDDGLVYAAEFAGVLHCLDAETGKVYWEHDLRADTWNSPFYVDGKIYIGDDHGKVTVFRHGKEKKILEVNQTPRNSASRWGSPVAVNGTLYLKTENPCRLWAIAEK
jgi:outer membrane protein assembly factor BamB